MSQAGSYNQSTGPFGPILQLTPDNGNPVVPLAGNIDVLGGNNSNGLRNIQTDGNPFNEPPVVPVNTLKVRLNDSIILPFTIPTGAEGVIALGVSDTITDRVLHILSDAIDGHSNLFCGYQAGNLSPLVLTNNHHNTGVGTSALSQITNDITDNTCIGFSSGAFYTTLSNANTGVGAYTFINATGSFNTAVGAATTPFIQGDENTAIGAEAGGVLGAVTGNTLLGRNAARNLVTGSYNTCLGYQAGFTYINAESSNILLGHTGVLAENNTIHIGTTGIGNGQQNATFIAGIAGTVVANQNFVVIDTVTEQLGSIAMGSFATTYTTDAGNATPAANVLNVLGGTGITTTGAGNTITISATVAPVSWSVIAVNQTAVVNNGYFCNKAGTLALALPAASSVGDIIEVANINTALGVQFTQAAGQQIFIAGTSTTLGATGTLTSSAVGDSLKLVCGVANTFWYAVSNIGSWTPA